MVLSNNTKEQLACLVVDIVAVVGFYLLFYIWATSFMLALMFAAGLGLVVGTIILEVWSDKIDDKNNNK